LISMRTKDLEWGRPGLQLKTSRSTATRYTNDQGSLLAIVASCLDLRATCPPGSDRRGCIAAGVHRYDWSHYPLLVDESHDTCDRLESTTIGSLDYLDSRDE
jgi:hypothetical protein